MRKELLNEIIRLKEEQKLLQAACGNTEIDRHIFTKEENQQLRHLWLEEKTVNMLLEVERRLHISEEAYRNELH